MKIKRDENKKISCTPPGKISNIIFEKKNTTQAKVKIGIKITLYIVIATFLATVTTNFFTVPANKAPIEAAKHPL